MSVLALESIHIYRDKYSPRIGELRGTITVESNAAKISVNLSEERAAQMVALVADQLVEQAHETASIITADLIENRIEDHSA